MVVKYRNNLPREVVEYIKVLKRQVDLVLRDMFSGALGSVRLMIGLHDVKGLFWYQWFYGNFLNSLEEEARKIVSVCIKLSQNLKKLRGDRIFCKYKNIWDYPQLRCLQVALISDTKNKLNGLVWFGFFTENQHGHVERSRATICCEWSFKNLSMVCKQTMVCKQQKISPYSLSCVSGQIAVDRFTMRNQDVKCSGLLGMELHHRILLPPRAVGAEGRLQPKNWHTKQMTSGPTGRE